MSDRKFITLEGIRAILSIWVVSIHVFRTLIHTSFSENQTIAFQLHGKPWQGIVTGQGLQVDVFFMISGFLFAMQQFNNNSDLTISGNFFLILKKLLRLWPTAFFVMVLSIFSDLRTDIYKLIGNTVLFLIEERSSPISLIVTWSNQVEVAACAVLGFLMIFFKNQLKIGKNGYYLAIVLIVVSLLPCILMMRSLPNLSVNVMKGLGIAKFTPIFMSKERTDWAFHRFGIRLSSSLYPAPMLDYSRLYLSFYTRWTPHFVGLFLAMSIYRAFYIDKNSEDHKHSKNGQWSYSIKHSLLLIASSLFLTLPLLLGMLFQGNKNSFSSDTTHSLKLSTEKSPIDYFFFVFLRPLYATAAAYLIYRCLLPSSHPLHLSGLNSFFSWKPLVFIGRYSYIVYLIHYRIIVEIMWGILPPHCLDVYFGTDRGLLHHFTYVLTVYLASLFFAYFIDILIESPCNYLSQRIISKISPFIKPMDKET